VALGLGVGSESRQPLAVAIAGGMISSTFLTLGVVPVAYSYLDQLSRWRLVGWVKGKVMAQDRGEEAEAEEAAGTATADSREPAAEAR
jgi:HAE1 family hydrophobic/amphiphilic exporter-1